MSKYTTTIKNHLITFSLYQQIRCELQTNALHTLSPGGSS